MNGDIQLRIAELLRANPYGEHLSCCISAEDHAAHVITNGLVLTPVPISYPADRANVRWWATASQWRGENGEWEWRT